MSKIRSKNTKPELVVRKKLHSMGFRFNLYGRYKNTTLPGKPDIVLPRYKTVIFINGCFWHGHQNCKNFRLPKSNVFYWKKKIRNNILRDKKNYASLIELGWKVLIIWECELKKSIAEKNIQALTLKILNK
ncbi:DNA mismatch endonuclease (patch repair protein) [Aureibacter tunicatorum]|uniref:Very short patch repair endonuclease n=2 Tax=Aureibacter tunicatorum TaxID=866807 RepID=A0AAE3XNN3_9BACT|nr:DNA mismatch endonuclease (patch repair protein) [Aureibacter tunicatorum]BDD04787.1 very short patch repair endonuclease [Aureibacter tunicatorum]